MDKGFPGGRGEEKGMFWKLEGEFQGCIRSSEEKAGKHRRQGTWARPAAGTSHAWAGRLAAR